MRSQAHHGAALVERTKAGRVPPRRTRPAFCRCLLQAVSPMLSDFAPQMNGWLPLISDFHWPLTT